MRILISQGHALNRDVLTQPVIEEIGEKHPLRGNHRFGRASCPHCQQARACLERAAARFLSLNQGACGTGVIDFFPAHCLSERRAVAWSSEIAIRASAMIITVKYADGTIDRIQSMLLDTLIPSDAITSFKRGCDWVVIGQNPIRRHVQQTEVDRERRTDPSTLSWCRQAGFHTPEQRPAAPIESCRPPAHRGQGGGLQGNMDDNARHQRVCQAVAINDPDRRLLVAMLNPPPLGPVPMPVVPSGTGPGVATIMVATTVAAVLVICLSGLMGLADGRSQHQQNRPDQ